MIFLFMVSADTPKSVTGIALPVALFSVKHIRVAYKNRTKHILWVFLISSSILAMKSVMFTPPPPRFPAKHVTYSLILSVMFTMAANYGSLP